MTTTSTNHLRLHVAPETPAPPAPPVEDIPGLAEMFDAVERLTGWRLSFRPAGSRKPKEEPVWSAEITAAPGHRPGRLLLTRGHSHDDTSESSAANPQPLPAVMPLIESIVLLVGELNQTRAAVWQREAELAASIPLVPHREEEAHLAERLESVLRGGAEAIGCHAAALYLLDDATSQLKMRACWGLPKTRLLAPARPLRGAVADLEALVGHAVALEDGEMFPYWRVPESCGAAVCVPVASPTMPLGTVWFYSHKARPFSSHQTNLIEIVAGRLAADLEREVLLGQGVEFRSLESQLAAVIQSQRHQLPQHPPLIEGWQIAAWLDRAGEVGGDFYDWHLDTEGRLSITLGTAHAAGMAAAMSVAALGAAVKLQLAGNQQPARVLNELGRVAYSGSAGDRLASLWLGRIEPDNGRMQFALAGNTRAMILRPHGWDMLSIPTPPLGQQERMTCKNVLQVIAAGDTLVLASDGMTRTLETMGRCRAQTWLSKIVGRPASRRRAGSGKISQAELATAIRRPEDARPQDDLALLILRRSS